MGRCLRAPPEGFRGRLDAGTIGAMGELVPLPKVGDIFTDIRGDDRTLRVSCHDETGMVVLSLWSGKLCRASFRLAEGDVPRLIGALTESAGARPSDPAPDNDIQQVAPEQVDTQRVGIQVGIQEVDTEDVPGRPVADSDGSIGGAGVVTPPPTTDPRTPPIGALDIRSATQPPLIAEAC